MKNAPDKGKTTRLVPLLRLGRCKCKWPAKYDARVLGNYLFCGRDTNGQNYCDMHKALTCVRQPRPAIGEPAWKRNAITAFRRSPSGQDPVQDQDDLVVVSHALKAQ